MSCKTSSSSFSASGRPAGRPVPVGVHCDPPPDERVARVMRHLDTLGLPERQVLLLRLQEGLSYEEIADVTGCSSGYVGTLLHQAVKKLAATIQQQEGA